MTSTLRALFGTRHRNHLAVEEIATPTEEQAAAAAANEPSNEDTTVVMKGPLADVYSEALGKVLDKSNPPEGDTTGVDSQDGQPNDGQAAPTQTVDTDNLTPTSAPEQGTVETAIASEVGTIVLESQAIDAAVAQSLAQAIADEAPAEGGTYETLYAIDETQVKPENVAEVTQILAEADKPENVTVLIDDVVPEGAIEESQQADIDAAKGLSASLESIVTAMGGKVVHSFKDYFEGRRTK